MKNQSTALSSRKLAAFIVFITGSLCLVQAAQAAATTYSGRATALRVDGVVTPPGLNPIIIADTGSLPPTGGLLEAHAVDVNIASGALTIDSADATTSGIGHEALSETQLTNYHAHFISDEGHDIVINADFIGASISASCNPSGNAQISGSTNIQNLTVSINGVTYTLNVTKKLNQRFTFPDCDTFLVVNQQVMSTDGIHADGDLVAIHFSICHCITGDIGHVQAGITCGETAEEDCLKLTGGGWIVLQSGAKGTFGVSGGIRRGQFWGHLTYIDHSTGMKVQSTAVTGVTRDPNDSDCVTITYAVLINGVAGTASVYVCDKGEPGKNDIFRISLSTGYSAGGDLGGSRPGGGNIQMHKCPPGWQ